MQQTIDFPKIFIAGHRGMVGSAIVRYLIATGVQYSVRDFVNAAAKELDIQIRWEGQGADEKGYDQNGKCIVAVDPRYYRPTEVETLLGDATKAKEKLGWTPKTSFEELVKEMAREDLRFAERD